MGVEIASDAAALGFPPMTLPVITFPTHVGPAVFLILIALVLCLFAVLGGGEPATPRRSDGKRRGRNSL
jgi:hypothetical protein